MTHHYALKYGWEFNPITGESIAILVPAYGRNYKTEAEMHAAWLQGFDFRMPNSAYCSIRDIELFKKFGAKEIKLIQKDPWISITITLEKDHVAS